MTLAIKYSLTRSGGAKVKTEIERVNSNRSVLCRTVARNEKRKKQEKGLLVN